MFKKVERSRNVFNDFYSVREIFGELLKTKIERLLLKLCEISC